MLLWLSLSATALKRRPDVADLCGAGGDWIGQGVQRAGGECDAAEPGAEGTLCQRGDVGRDGLPDCEYVGAGGGRDSVYAAAGGVLQRWNGAPVVYAFTLVMLLGFIVLVSMIRREDGDDGEEGVQREDGAGGA